MFKDKPRLIVEIKKAFVLKLLVVSSVGFLTSNEEFHFNDTYLRDQMVSTSKSFLAFMRVLLSKITPAMLANFFWARKLREIVQQKLQFIIAEAGGDRSQVPPVQLSFSKAVTELE